MLAKTDEIANLSDYSLCSIVRNYACMESAQKIKSNGYAAANVKYPPTISKWADGVLTLALRGCTV